MANNEKKYLTLGSYPQTLIRDRALIDELNAAAGNLPTTKSFGKWTSYRFYMKGEKSDYMWYSDVTLGGKMYRGVYIKLHRPYDIDGDSTDFNQSGHQGYFGFRIDRVYWFEYNPIEFDVLDCCEDGSKLLYSRYVLDATQFGDLGPWRYLPYEKSVIRKWLNSEFFNTAFTPEQQSMLCACGIENDKVTLLSLDEYKKHCSTDGGWRKAKRLTTDYARCMGVNAESAYGICNFYWLRTVKGDETDATFYGVGTLGNVEDLCFSSSKMDGGVAIAIIIRNQ